MYRSHFGLNQSPFNITPNPAFFYSGSKRGDILAALIYAVSHGEGIIKVTGEVGCGKTMLCRMLESRMPEHVEVIYLVNPTLSREEVMFTIAGELEIPTAGKRPDEVIRLLHQDLISKHILGKQVVLLVEEAQAMPLETLEEIRLFSNLETAQHKLLQIVLFGQPELNQTLSLPRMRQLKERITHSFSVPPMTAAIIPDFLMFRMRTAGYHGPDIFNKGAIRLLASVSEGIVRRINILADKSLLAAFADNSHAVQVKHVKAAISDSEFMTERKPPHPQRNLAIALLVVIALVVLLDLAWRRYWPGDMVAASAQKSPAAVARMPKPSLSAQSIETVVPTVPVASVTESGSVSGELGASADDQGWPVSGLVRQRMLASKIWLREKPNSFFTVQIGMIEIDKLEKLEQLLQRAGRQLGSEELFIYPSRAHGSAGFGVLVSGLATREEASQRQIELGSKWNYQGQIRSIGELRSEIWRSQSEDLW